MQTALVIRTHEILAAQTHNSPVIPPQEKSNNDIKRPGTSDLAPDSPCANIQRGHDGKRRKPLQLGRVALRHIHRNHDRAADDAHENEDVAAHLGEAQEEGGVQTDAAHQLLLIGVQHGFKPGKEAPAHGGWCVFAVRMLDLGSIDDGVARTDEREEEA